MPQNASIWAESQKKKTVAWQPAAMQQFNLEPRPRHRNALMDNLLLFLFFSVRSIKVSISLGGISLSTPRAFVCVVVKVILSSSFTASLFQLSCLNIREYTRQLSSFHLSAVTNLFSAVIYFFCDEKFHLLYTQPSVYYCY
jgi:hypothetical protein